MFSTTVQIADWHCGKRVLSGLQVSDDYYIVVYKPKFGYVKSELAIAHYISLVEKASCAQLFNGGITNIALIDGVAEVATREGSRY